MRKLLLVFGTRPEAIKMAPVALGLRGQSGEFETVLCSTGQHESMLNQTLSAFGLKPDIDLKLMTPRQTLADLTARAVGALDNIITRVRPDLVVVQGDTTSAMVGTLAAYYHRTPVAHVEAGLRTDDPYRPFPEEGNRRLIGTLAALHLPRHPPPLTDYNKKACRKGGSLLPATLSSTLYCAYERIAGMEETWRGQARADASW